MKNKQDINPETYAAHLECGGEHCLAPKAKPYDLAGILEAVRKGAEDGDPVCVAAWAQLRAKGVV